MSDSTLYLGSPRAEAGTECRHRRRSLSEERPDVLPSEQSGAHAGRSTTDGFHPATQHILWDGVTICHKGSKAKPPPDHALLSPSKV